MGDGGSQVGDDDDIKRVTCEVSFEFKREKKFPVICFED